MPAEELPGLLAPNDDIAVGTIQQSELTYRDVISQSPDAPRSLLDHIDRLAAGQGKGLDPEPNIIDVGYQPNPGSFAPEAAAGRSLIDWARSREGHNPQSAAEHHLRPHMISPRHRGEHEDIIGRLAPEEIGRSVGEKDLISEAVEIADTVLRRSEGETSSIHHGAYESSPQTAGARLQELASDWGADAAKYDEVKQLQSAGQKLSRNMEVDERRDTDRLLVRRSSLGEVIKAIKYSAPIKEGLSFGAPLGSEQSGLQANLSQRHVIADKVFKSPLFPWRKKALETMRNQLEVAVRLDTATTDPSFVSSFNTFLNDALGETDTYDGVRHLRKEVYAKMLDHTTALEDLNPGEYSDDEKCLRMALSVEDNHKLVGGNIEFGYLRHSDEGLKYLNSVFDSNMSQYSLGVNTKRADGRASGSFFEDYMSMSAKSHTVGVVKYEDIVAGEFNKLGTVHELCDVAEAAGFSGAEYISLAAKRVSRDYGDFPDVCEYLLQRSDSENREQILLDLCSGYLTNSVDPTVRANLERGDNNAGGVLHGAYEYAYHEPFPLSRTLEPALFLAGKLDTLDTLDGGSGKDELVGVKNKIARDALIHLSETVLRPEYLDVSRTDLKRLWSLMDGLDPDERISGMSSIVAAFNKITPSDSGELTDDGVDTLISLHHDFVPTFDENGLPADTFNIQLEDSGVFSDGSEPFVTDMKRFMYADMMVGYLGALINSESPSSNLAKLLDRVPDGYRSDVESMLLYKTHVDSKRMKVMNDAQEIAGESLIRYQDYAREVFDMGVPDEAVNAETERIKADIGVSINISADNILRILQEPPYRFQSTFENSSRGTNDGYNLHRDLAEEAMGVRRVATDMICDPQPIYGAVTSPNGRDEFFGGAGSGFGSVFVELDTNSIADRTVAVPLDSGRYWDTRTMQVPLDYAARFAAINNITQNKYPEAIIMGGVSVDDIKVIKISSGDSSAVSRITSVVRELYPDIKVEVVDQKRATSSKSSIIVDGDYDDRS
ncbi:MAG: hypothetical protein ABI220_05745 [Candidatus Saccharimonadales bacterium]